MQRRTLWIVLASVGVLLAVLCGGAAIVSYLAYNVLNATQTQTQRRLEEITRQLESRASASPESSLDDPTATPRARATTTPRAASPAPGASEAATAQSSGDAPADLPDRALPDDADLAAGLVGASRAALSERPDVPSYRISATLDPQQHTISGSERVTLTNTEGTPLDTIYFRLYVNAPHYGEGGITVADVRVDDVAVAPTLEQDDTVLKLPLAQPLAPGQRAEIALNFAVTVPTSGGGYGLFNESDGVFMLYNWHPELAVYENGEWLLNPVVDQGDPTNTDMANYLVSFAAPEDFTVISSGVEQGSAPQDGGTAHTFVGPLTRNFVVVASDQFTSATQDVGETRVTSYYRAESEQGGKAALQTAAGSLELFGKQFGAYPYSELDVVEVELGSGAAGMESTGMVMIGRDYYDPAEANPLGEGGGFLDGSEGANVLTFTTAHEVAHQWWYGVVGSDAYKQPWLDESLTNWSAAYYVDQTEGEAAGKLARDLFVALPYRDTLSSGDIKLDQPVDQFSAQEYGAIVYGKGALMYDVLRAELGDATFLQFLQRYYREQSFDRANDQAWLKTLSAVAGKDMTPFYQKWVEGTAIKEQDLPPGGPLSEFLGGNFDDLLPEPSSGP